MTGHRISGLQCLCCSALMSQRIYLISLLSIQEIASFIFFLGMISVSVFILFIPFGLSGRSDASINILQISYAYAVIIATIGLVFFVASDMSLFLLSFLQSFLVFTSANVRVVANYLEFIFFIHLSNILRREFLV